MAEQGFSLIWNYLCKSGTSDALVINGISKRSFALSFMHDLVSNSINHQPGQGVFQARHKLSAEETPSEYSIQFHLK